MTTPIKYFPMPQFTPIWNGDDWICTLALPAWKPFLHSDDSGQIEVVLVTEDEGEKARPTELQLTALGHIHDNQSELFSVMEAALRKFYTEVHPSYAQYVEEPESVLPDNPDAAQFAAMHELQCIFVHPVAVQGLAYVGFSFRALWEMEHGIGILTHDRRIVAAGGADTAFLTWIAEKDAAER